jgi:peptidoglycan/LPS O-acetylase OafA/YrhL
VKSSPTFRSSGRGDRRPDIQGLRALAILLVVCYHAGLPVRRGFTGVDVFFAISGFVITGLLLSELEGTGTLRLRVFYARRVRRLLPALALMLTTIAALGTLVSPVGAQSRAAITTMAATLFSANLYLAHLDTGYFAVEATLNPLLHTWTLAVEEQFYLVFPIILVLAWKLMRRPGAIVAIGTVSLASFLYAVHLSNQFGASARFAFYGSPTRAWEFGLGALTALAAPAFCRAGALGSTVAGVAGTLLIGVEMWAAPAPSWYSASSMRFPVVGTCLLLIAGTGAGGPLTRLLSIRPAVWIGNLSYSWYLWHWPLIVYAKAALPGGWAAPMAAAFSLVPAWLSHRFVENPIRHSPRVRGRRLLAVAFVCLAVPLAAGAGLGAVHSLLERNPRFAQLDATQRLHADVVRGCDAPQPLGERTGARCFWRAPDPRGTIVLVGDSNAGHITEPVVRAANELRYNAIVATFSSCPFVYSGVASVSYADTECGTFVSGTLRRLLQLRPNLVVLSIRADQYVEVHDTASPGDHFRAALGLVGSASANARVLEQALEHVLRALNRAGIPVVVVYPIPQLPFHPAGCSVFRVLLDACAGTVARAPALAELRHGIAAERQAIDATTNTSAVDLTEKFCNALVCTTRHDGVDDYRDADHLSIAGALTLTGRFRTAIADRARSSSAASADSPRRHTLSHEPES